MTPLGKRFTFAQAAEYLDIPESRLRQHVRHRRISFHRTDGRILTRKHGTGSQRYVKSGRIELRQADLDDYLAAQRVPALAGPVTVRAVGRRVDREVSALIQRLDEHP